MTQRNREEARGTGGDGFPPPGSRADPSDGQGDEHVGYEDHGKRAEHAEPGNDERHQLFGPGVRAGESNQGNVIAVQLVDHDGVTGRHVERGRCLYESHGEPIDVRASGHLNAEVPGRESYMEQGAADDPGALARRG